MEKQLRKIIHIDQDLCNGCGQCAQACAEGAIQIVNGKARLISETYCDGLGACIGECPQGAITMVEQYSQPFDDTAAARHLAASRKPLPCGCPGTQVQDLKPEAASCCPGSTAGVYPADGIAVKARPSQLSNWPVQITLIPPQAPYLKQASLIIAADCVPFAYAGFHERFLPGKVLLVGCPKLDDAEAYRRKLAEIFSLNAIQAVEVAYMEVPCCTGLVRLVQAAIQDAGKDIPLTLTQVGIRGELL